MDNLGLVWCGKLVCDNLVSLLLALSLMMYLADGHVRYSETPFSFH